MPLRFTAVTGVACLSLIWFVVSLAVRGPTLQAEEPPTKKDSLPATSAVSSSVEEARARARLLYRSLSGALQVMHRDLFDEEKSLRIPSRSLEDVFDVLHEDDQVKLRWVAVNATPMSVDHTPADDFEKKAAKAIAAGQTEFELAENGVYRYAGAIRLGNQCLKCHVPNRKSLEDRFSALVLSMPYQDGKSPAGTNSSP